MAKMFYTMEETKSALGRTEDEVKGLVRDGKLREFRDGPRLMFKADQVDSLKGTLGPRDMVDLADSGAPISLVDSRGGTGGGSAAGAATPGGSAGGGVAMAGSASAIPLDGSAAGDIGLGGSVGGIPSPRSGTGTGMGMASRSGSGTGMNIFNPDDAMADPSAATAITPASESGNLEVVGSGSGLLDLTRESDDTSLGSVLEDIGGKRDKKAGTAMAMGGTGMGPAMATAAPVAMAPRQAPILVARPDPLAPFFGGLALGGALMCLLAIFVVAAGTIGARVTFLAELATKGLLIVAAIGLGVTLICGAVGFGLGKVLK